MQLPQEIKDRVNNALNDGFPLALAAVSADAEPLVSFRGSTQSFGDDALAVWVRGAPSATLEAIAANPQVALIYTNMPERKFYIFRGRARITDAPNDRAAIWEGQHPLEQSRDLERTGTAVVIDLDRVSGSGVDLHRTS